MKTIKDFLEEYTKLFPKKINFGNNCDFINKTNMLTFDYADGLITFFNHGVDDNTLEDIYDITGSGGDNSCNFYDTQEYQYIWAELLQKEPKFIKFMSDHQINHENLMVLVVKWQDLDEEIGKQEIECNFTFYENLPEN